MSEIVHVHVHVHVQTGQDIPTGSGSIVGSRKTNDGTSNGKLVIRLSKNRQVIAGPYRYKYE